jgi:hypothetical protein
MKATKKIAFEFVLEELNRLQPVARPMFGCHGIYIGEKLVLVTRDKGGEDRDDGVWLATDHEHHESLRREVPSLRSISILGKGETKWQIIPKDSYSFEEDVLKVCSMILKHDLRIGTVPVKKKKAALKTIRKR